MSERDRPSPLDPRSPNEPTPPAAPPDHVIERLGCDATTALVRLSGALDLAAEADVTAVLVELAGTGLDVVVDLSGVTFLESVAIAALLRGARAAEAHGRRLRVCAPSPIVRAVLTVSGLTEHLGLDDAG